MLALLGLVALVLTFFSFAFGAIRLLLKGTALEEYTFEASLLLGPLLLVLTLSCGGYVTPQSLSLLQVSLVVFAGVVLSAIVALCDRRALSDLLRHNGRRLLLLMAFGAWAMIVLVLYYPGNPWRMYFSLGNGEYINYALLAARLTGQCPATADDPTPAFLAHHPQLRFGQDIITAAVALLSGRHPINVVEPLSIFFRFQYAIALGLVLYRLAGERRAWLVALLLFVDGYLLVETFSFTTSFLSSNCTLCLYLLYVALLVGSPESLNGRAVVLIMLANVYFLVTYPELLPLVKALELAQVVVWLIRRQRQRWAPFVIGNLATCVLHPVLVYEKARIAYTQATGLSGWDIFSNPKQTPWTYLGNVLGLRYAHVPEEVFVARPGLAMCLMASVLVLIVAGLLVLALKHRLGLAIGLWLSVAMLLHALPVLREGRHYYPAVKFLTQSFFVPLAAIAALGGVRSRVLRGWTWGTVTAWAAAAGLATITVFAAVPKHGVAYDYPRLCRALATHGAGRGGVVGLVQAEELWLLQCAAKHCGLTVVPVSGFQHARLQRARGTPRPSWAVPRADDEPFEGLFLVSTRAESAPAFAPFGVEMLGAGPGRQLFMKADGRIIRFDPLERLAALGADDLYLGRLSYSDPSSPRPTAGTP
jgi:hypothetical protein